MSFGLSARAALLAATYTTVHRQAGDSHATVNIRVTNRDLNNPTQIRLAICPPAYIDGQAPADADYIEAPDFALLAGQPLEETGQPLSPGECVVAYATTAQVSVRVAGFKSADIAE